MWKNNMTPKAAAIFFSHQMCSFLASGTWTLKILHVYYSENDRNFINGVARREYVYSDLFHLFVRDFGKLQLNISNDAYRSFPEDIRLYPTLLQTKAHINWGVLLEYSMY